ncbi:MAG: hypothetical protein RR356_03155 [Bacteroidales bacterium]
MFGKAFLLGVPASPSRFPLQVLISLCSIPGFPLQSLTREIENNPV